MRGALRLLADFQVPTPGVQISAVAVHTSAPALVDSPPATRTRLPMAVAEWM
jgi:hypothetical protein